MRVVFHAPVQLLGVAVGGRGAAWLYQRGEGRHPLVGFSRLGAQGLGQVGVLRAGQLQQGAAFVGQLQKLENIQRGGIAHDVIGINTAKAMAAYLIECRQVLRRHIQASAACVRVDGLEGMRGALDLGRAASCIINPGTPSKLRLQLSAFGIIRLQRFELAVQPFGQERLDQGSELGLTLRVRSRHRAKILGKKITLAAHSACACYLLALFITRVRTSKHY